MKTQVNASLEDVPHIITAEQIEAWELIAKDTRKEFSYYKETGKWNWHNRGESGHQHGPFQTRLDALFDAVEPYYDADENIENEYPILKPTAIEIEQPYTISLIRSGETWKDVS